MTVIKLYYVDDQDDFLYLLEMDIALMTDQSPCGFELKPFTGAYQPEGFLNAVKSTPDPDAVFLLDAKMTVPRQLLGAKKFWTESERGKEDYCGIALAKYLTTNGVAADRIALITHWKGLMTEHHEALNNLGLSAVKALSKSADGQDALQAWLLSLTP